MGVPLAELTDTFGFAPGQSKSPNVFWGTPPRPAPGFGSYFVVATSKNGLCKLAAIADVDVVNDAGDQVRGEADRIADMIESKYGKSTKKYDYAPDVARRNPQFWMMHLKDSSAAYAYDWVNGKGGLSLPNDIAEIEIIAGATDTNRGFVRLSYTFTNDKQCQDEIKKQKSTNL